MRNAVKKAIFFVISLLIILGLFTAYKPHQVMAAASADIDVSSATCTLGDEVTININVSATEAIMVVDLWFQYDSTMLDLIPDNDPNPTVFGGSGGIFRVLSTEKTSFEVKFRTKSVGETGIKLYNYGETGSSFVSGMNTDRMTLKVGEGKITSNAPAEFSSENSLKTLSISPGVLSPTFTPGTINYTTIVASNVKELVINAVPEDSKATVSVIGTNLKTGKNTVSVKVTAQNGTVKTYTIICTREEGDESESQGESQEEVDVKPSVLVSMEGLTYLINSDFNTNPLPKGFAAESYVYEGHDVNIGKAVNGSVKIMYLEAQENGGISGFYTYDSVTNRFSKFVQITSPEVFYVILPIDSSMETPENFVKEEYEINGELVDVLKTSDSNDYCIFYGMNSDGSTGWYCYNYSTKYIWKYTGENSLPYATVPDNTGNSQKKNIWKTYTVILGIVAFIAVIAVIYLLIRLKNVTFYNANAAIDEAVDNIAKAEQAAKAEIRAKKEKLAKERQNIETEEVQMIPDEANSEDESLESSVKRSSVNYYDDVLAAADMAIAEGEEQRRKRELEKKKANQENDDDCVGTAPDELEGDILLKADEEIDLFDVDDE